MSQARDNLHLEDKRYISWLKTQRKFPSDELYKQYAQEVTQGYISWLKIQKKSPSDELYKQYVAEINQNPLGISSFPTSLIKPSSSGLSAGSRTCYAHMKSLDPADKPLDNEQVEKLWGIISSLPSEKTAIQARKIWTEVVSETHKMNDALIQSKNIKQAVIQRIEKLNYSMCAEAIYDRMISLLQYNSVIVLSFDAKNLAKDLTSFQTLNLREKGSHNLAQHTTSGYSSSRKLCEETLYKHLSDNLKNLFFSNLSALPKYAALFILDRNQTISPSSYGTSFIVLQDFVKLNSLYMPADTFLKYKTCQLSTYHHFELFLSQCNEEKFKALVIRAVRGTLPAKFTQTGDSGTDAADTYFEASIPAINFFDLHFVQHIHINCNEYVLNQQEMDALTHLNLSFSNERVSPFPKLCKQFMDAVYANDVKTAEKYLSQWPVLARITNGNGHEPITLAPFTVKQKLMQMGVRQHAHSVFSKLKSDNEYEYDLIKIIKTDDLNEFINHRQLISQKIFNQLIYLAAENGAITILTLLIRKNLEINTYNSAGITPLMAAVWNNHYTCVEALVKTGRADLDSKMPGGHTALTNAVEQKNCHVNIVRLLMNAPGIEKIINKARNADGKSALYIAASLGYTEKLAVLLDYSDIDITLAAIQAAEKNGHRDAACMLTESQDLFKAINNLTHDGDNPSRTEAVDKLKSYLKNKNVRRHFIKSEYENFIKQYCPLYSKLINIKTLLQASLESSQKSLSSYPELAAATKIEDFQINVCIALINFFKKPTETIEPLIKTAEQLIDDIKKLTSLLNDLDIEINKYALETPERMILEKLKKRTIDSFNSDLFSFEFSQQKLQLEIYHMINAVISNASLTAKPDITYLKEKQNNRFKQFIENSHFLNSNSINHFHDQIFNEINARNQFISLTNKIESTKAQPCATFDLHFTRNTCYDILLSNIIDAFNKDIYSFVNFYKLFDQKIDDLNQANLKIGLLDRLTINETITPQAMATIENHIQAIYFNQTKNIDLFVDTLLTIWPSIFKLQITITSIQKHGDSLSPQEANKKTVIKLLFDELIQKLNAYIEQSDYLDKNKTSQFIAFCNTQLEKANTEIYKMSKSFFNFFKKNQSANLLAQVKADLEMMGSRNDGVKSQITTYKIISRDL